MFAVNTDALFLVLTTLPYVEMLLYLAAGTLVGLAIGAAPGLSPPLAIALGLPLAFALPFHEGIALLVGLYKGSMFGGSITAISFATPGEPAAGAIVEDGIALTRRGDGGKALKTSLYAGSLGDMASDLLLVFAAIPLGLLAPLLGPAELTALFFVALTLIIVFSPDAPRGVIAAGIGFFIGTIGRDVQTGVIRLDFGIDELRSGIPLVALLLGLFTIPEMIEQVRRLWLRRGQPEESHGHFDIKQAMRQRLTLREFWGNWRALGLGTGIGSFLGALPGPGSTLAAYTAYGLSRQLSRHPERYGKGSLEAIAAAESANNAVAGANLIPLLAFGVPGSAVAGLFGAALLMKGVPPGPRVIVDFPEAIYTLFIIFIVGNLVNLVLGRLTIPFFARLAHVPKTILWPVIGATVIIGTYSYDVRPFDVYVLLGAGVLGWMFRLFLLPLGPLVLAFLVGPLFEESLARSLVLARGDYTYFIGSWGALFLWALSLCAVLFFVWGQRRTRLLERQAQAAE